MASTTDIKNGFCFHFNHDIYKVVEFLHVKPGKGPAFVRTKLKSLRWRQRPTTYSRVAAVYHPAGDLY